MSTLGAAPRQLADFVAHRVFDLERDKIETRKRALGCRDIDTNGSTPHRTIRSRARRKRPINIVLPAKPARCHLPEHPAGDPAFEIDPVADQKIAAELHAAANRVDFVAP